MTARVDAAVSVALKGDGSCDFVAGKYYYKGELVMDSGALYVCLANTNFSTTAPGSDSTHWLAISAS